MISVILMGCSNMGSNIYTGHIDEEEGFIIKWKFETNSVIDTNPAINDNGTIYFGTWNGNLYAVTPEGDQKWVFKTDDKIYSSPTVGPQGNIYFGNDQGKLYSVDSEGNENWVCSPGSKIRTSPAIGEDGTIYVANDAGELYAIDNNGNKSKIWTNSNSTGTIHSSPVISNGVIYFGSDDGNLYAVSSEGNLEGSFATDSEIKASPALGKDNIYFATSEGTVYSLPLDFYNNSSPEENWSKNTSDVEAGPAIGPDGTIYVVGAYGIKAFAKDGSLQWDDYNDASSPKHSSPTLGENNVFFGASHSFKKVGSEGSNSEFKIFKGAVASSPALGSNGMIYVGCYDGNLYAINTNSEGLAATSWPKFQANNQNTGRR